MASACFTSNRVYPGLERVGVSHAILEHWRIEDFDVAIGSIAIVHGARLATLHVKHLSRLDGLDVEDWSP